MSREDMAIILTFTIVIVLAVICGIGWHVIDHIKSKRPHKSDDEEDNPITKFKDDLAEAFENHPNRSVRKLARAIWDRLVQIEKWHDEEISDIERRYYSATCDAEELKERCNKYNKELGEWYARYDNLKHKFEESQAQLRKAEAKAKTQPEYLIEKRYPGQINPFAKVVFNTGDGKPLTETEATELSERLQRIAGQPLVSKEDVVEKLIDL